MLIRMIVQMPGTRDGEPWPRLGEPVEMATAQAAHLVGAGVAEPVPAVEPEAVPRVPRARRAKTPAGPAGGG